MNIRLACVAVAASVLLLGCMTSGAPGEPGGGTKGPDCTGASCMIDVVVDCHSSPCSAMAMPKRLYVATPNGVKVILWKLHAPDGYAFAEEGVQFASGAPFTCPHPGGGQREITCNDKHEQPGEYGYTLAVVKTGDPTSRIPVDPWIVNR